MASPIKPQDTAALVINPSDKPCDAWKKFLKALWYYYKWTKYRKDEDGEIAAAWQADLCAAVVDCPTVTTTT